jgi:hypothetical protein
MLLRKMSEAEKKMKAPVNKLVAQREQLGLMTPGEIGRVQWCAFPHGKEEGRDAIPFPGRTGGEVFKESFSCFQDRAMDMRILG